ncbi:extracellular solute-binding protein [Mycoplasmatota bacterium WC44]
MKKTITLLFILLFLLVGCTEKKETLYILGSGDYIDVDLIKQFETEYDVNVILDEVTSTKELYTKIKSSTKDYDVLLSSDYMVEKLIDDNMLFEIDQSKLTNQPNYFEQLVELHSIYDEESKYSVPYSWGTIGLMYDLSVEYQVLKNGWKVLFEETNGIYKVGMYDSSRDAVSSALLYLDLDPNTILESDLALAEAVLKQFEYEVFGVDDLKSKVVSSELDVALVNSRDFFKQLYSTLGNEQEKTFGFFVPENTNVWIENLVIPGTSQNTDLAHKFIDFMINKNNAYTNVKYNKNCTVDKDVYRIMENPEEGMDGFINHPYYYPLNEGVKGFVYRYLGEDYNRKIDDILINIKG